MSSRADHEGSTDLVEVRPVDGEPYRPALPVLERTDRAGVLASFVDAVENGGEPSSPAADNLRSVALMDAALRSSVSGAFVPVDLGS
jgi:predicted dehydrogenase